MAQTTYHVTLSSNGRYSVDVTSDDPGEMASALEWAETICSRLASPDQPVEKESDEAPICPVHGTPMVKQNGKYGSFWSCHQRNPDGSFCTHRPKTE